MNFADTYLQFVAVLLATLMGAVEFVNWLNRKHGGFMKAWAEHYSSPCAGPRRLHSSR